MHKQLSIADLFKCLDHGGIIITPNQRLCTTLHYQYSKQPFVQEKKVWPTPRITALSTWLIEHWQTLQQTSTTALPILLSPWQEQLIWQNIIKASKKTPNLLQPEAAAQIAMQAWKQLQQYQQSINDVKKYPISEDVEIYITWAEEYTQYCKINNYIDNAELINYLIEHQTITPNHITLTGFDQLTPIQEKWILYLKQAGCVIKHNDLYIHDSTVNQLGIETQEKEIEMMAHWAKQTLTHMEHKKEATPIACIVPQLIQNRSMIEKVFSSIFSDQNENTFNISIGQALKNYPIIHTALQALQCFPGNIAWDNMSHLLRSPFIGHAEVEMSQRALFDKKLRESEFTHYRLKYIISFDDCPLFVKQIQKAASLIPTTKQRPSEWATIFSSYLNTLGWPGERGLNSEEYQCVERFSQLLEEFSGLDTILGLQSKSQAFQTLFNQTALCQFQPKPLHGSENAPIQILGLLEASGQLFSHLWIMGFDDQTWPSKPSPNPFIPLIMQRKLNMPHANAEREYDYSQKNTLRLCHSAKTVIFSYPMYDQDRKQQISPLINHIPTTNINALIKEPLRSPQKILFDARELEYYQDNTGPSVTQQESICGGVDLLKQQALCPFRAFAYHRLQAESLSTPSIGVQALQRGIITHDILEQFWKEVKTQSGLLAMSEESLNELISKIIESSFKKHLDIFYSLGKKTRSLEKKRLLNLITQWLNKEKERTDFKIIALEKSISITLANITIKMRIDRIDQTRDGDILLIDYKTGQVSVNSWFGERLSEPQLPLYSLAYHQPIAGLFFAQINSKQQKYVGVTKNDISKFIANDSNDNAEIWSSQQALWQKTLEQLMLNFKSGHAAVDPQYPGITCQTCDLHSLCRVHDHD